MTHSKAHKQQGDECHAIHFEWLGRSQGRPDADRDSNIQLVHGEFGHGSRSRRGSPNAVLNVDFPVPVPNYRLSPDD